MENPSVILFYSTNYAIWTKNVLQKLHIEHKMASVPRHLSSECGYCVMIQNQDKEKIIQILHQNGIEYDRIESLIGLS
ncbi:MAG: DUF3343 domain-containing protein [Candidatus Brocadiae bacterium]|nr:DUF3343 domain-containing protein [Candidatus Brocadiia bacterium]